MQFYLQFLLFARRLAIISWRCLLRLLYAKNFYLFCHWLKENLQLSSILPSPSALSSKVTIRSLFSAITFISTLDSSVKRNTIGIWMSSTPSPDIANSGEVAAAVPSVLSITIPPTAPRPWHKHR